MSDRDFSDSAKLEVIKANLEKNGGNIACESCGRKLSSISECHFDHIFPYSKGGKSVASNCQLLCSECNLKKNDKLLKDFMLEEQAKKFLSGGTLSSSSASSISDPSSVKSESSSITDCKSSEITKENFDESIRAFIKKKGNIHKVDFGRAYNNLPSIHNVRKYYGDLKTMKKAFGIVDLSLEWNRDTIRTAILDYVEKNGDIFLKDLTKQNGLPSLPCVLHYYPEFTSFSDIKSQMCGLKIMEHWTRESTIEAGKKYLKTHDSITESCFKKKNGLPAMNVIYNYFGNMQEYQKEIGAPLSSTNELITKNEIRNELDRIFENKERVVESANTFFPKFKYSKSTVDKRYGSFLKMCEEESITVLNTKKANYTKREVDDAILTWIKEHGTIPRAKDLTKLGLPSSGVILKYYEDWKEPFVMYLKIHEEMKR